MHDMNFFSVYKKRRAKSKGLRIFLIVFIAALLIVNGALIGGGLWLFNQLETDIQEKQDWINDPATIEAIIEANFIQEEYKILNEYMENLQVVDGRITNLKYIKPDLFLQLNSITPIEVEYTNILIDNKFIRIDCIGDSILDVLDFYHATIQDEMFGNVSLSTININEETEAASFTISFYIMEDD